MLGFTVKLSILASVLLILTDSIQALSAAGAQVLAQANTFLNNASIPQEYKDLLLEQVKSGAGVTSTSTRLSGKSSHFSTSAKYAAAPSKKCGSWCCGIKLVPYQVSYKKKVRSTCYRQVTEYYRRGCFFCWGKRKRTVTKSFSCLIDQAHYRLQQRTCPANQYTTCCEGYVPINNCCISIEGLRAIIEFIKILFGHGKGALPVIPTQSYTPGPPGNSRMPGPPQSDHIPSPPRSSRTPGQPGQNRAPGQPRSSPMPGQPRRDGRPGQHGIP